MYIILSFYLYLIGINFKPITISHNLQLTYPTTYKELPIYLLDWRSLCDAKDRFRDLIGKSMMFDRITFDPQIMGGRACIRGMRITVSLVVSLVANGMSNCEIIEAYPYLEAADIQACLNYAAFLANEEIHSFSESA